MTEVHPFRAFRYNPQRVSFDRVLTQPYDKISSAMQEHYYAADLHNLITIEKGRAFPKDTPEDNAYTRAVTAWQEWIRDGVVVQDPAPAFYAYTQGYCVPGTQERRLQRGLIGAGKLEEYSAGIVFRHEHTLLGPKADRLELLRHTQTQTGQLFMLYTDPQRKVDVILAEAESDAEPATQVHDEYGVLHRLWVIAEPQRVAAIQEAMAAQKLVIADGHHRYETALTYRNERRKQAGRGNPVAAYERAMMTFVNTRSEGLTILPTHRVAANLVEFSWSDVRRYLEPWFAAEAFPFGSESKQAAAREKFLARLMETRGQRSIGVYPEAEAGKRAYYVLTLRSGANLTQLLPSVSALQRELDVVLLHEGILEPALGITPQAVKTERNLTYEREAMRALAAVDSGKAQVAFLLNACQVEQMVRIATAGEVMPQKSTDFYPKLLSGMTMYRADD